MSEAEMLLRIGKTIGIAAADSNTEAHDRGLQGWKRGTIALTLLVDAWIQPESKDAWQLSAVIRTACGRCRMTKSISRHARKQASGRMLLVGCGRLEMRCWCPVEHRRVQDHDGS